MAASTSPPTWRPSDLGAAHGPGVRRLAVAVAPAAVAALPALAYLALVPGSADLAAQGHRAWLASGGHLLWDGTWYGGHPTPGYSLLATLLEAAAGVRVAGALAVVAAAALFAALARGAYGPRRALAGSLWFAAGVSAQLLTGRIAFLLGVAVGLGALLAAQRGRHPLAWLLAALTAATSPVAAGFLALAAIAWALGSRRAAPAVLAAVALIAAALVARLFPEAGTEPFVASAFWPGLVALVALLVALPTDERTARTAVALTALATVACFAVPSAAGGNVTRLGALVAGPLAACALGPSRRRALAALVVPLAWWQLVAPVHDVLAATGDPAASPSYYRPLLAELRRDGGPRWALAGRLEVPLTAGHQEADVLARHVPLVGGWERQLSRAREAPLLRHELTAAGLAAWLRGTGARWVALPDAPLDGSSQREAALLRAGVPGLRPLWRSAHWRLWELERPLAPVSGVARVTGLTADTVALRAARPGTATVRVRWSPYWALAGRRGCVWRAPGGWVAVRLRDAGPALIGQRFSLWRGLEQATGPRCTGRNEH